MTQRDTETKAARQPDKQTKQRTTINHTATTEQQLRRITDVCDAAPGPAQSHYLHATRSTCSNAGGETAQLGNGKQRKQITTTQSHEVPFLPKAPSREPTLHPRTLLHKCAQYSA